MAISNAAPTDIPEMSFSIPRVQTELEKYFKVVGILSEQQFTEWTGVDDKAVFVCRLA